MSASRKTGQLQIRVSAAEKAAIQRAARQAGMDMSAWVRQRVLPGVGARFRELASACADESGARFALAELNSFLAGLGASELRDAVASPLPTGIGASRANYVAAMVEYACAKQGVAPPSWTTSIEPPALPEFGSSLVSLRLYLLTHSPPPFRRRNIFIDASIGDRV